MLQYRQFCGIIPPFKRVDGNEYIGGTVREPADGEKQVSEADGKSSRSVELKFVKRKLGETESPFVIKARG
jgi:hypothetical protein